MQSHPVVTAVIAMLKIAVLSSLSCAAFAVNPHFVSSIEPTHLAASTGNLYWTSNSVNDASPLPYSAEIWKTTKNSKPGEERLIYSETSSSRKEFGNFVFAYVGAWYGYFIVNDMSGNPSTYRSSIKRIPLSGGSAVTLATLSRFVGNRSLRTDGAYLYWADTDGIRRMPISGSTSPPVATAKLAQPPIMVSNITTLATTVSVKYIELGSNFVYYSDGTAIRRVRTTGGVVEQFADSSAQVTALYVRSTATGTQVIWGDANGAVRCKAVGESTVTTLQSPVSQTRVTSVGYDGVRVLWTYCTGSGNGCGVRYRRGQQTVSLVPGDTVSVDNLQWDATQIFWGSAGGIWKYVY